MSEFEDLKKEALNVAINYIAYQPRSVFETLNKLKQKGYSPKICDAAIEKLVKAQYLDDFLLAKSFRDEAISNCYGIQRVRYILFKKGISGEIAEEVIAGYDFDGEPGRAEEVASKRLSRLTALDGETKRRRLLSFLQRRGFMMNLAIQVCDKLISRSDVEE